MTHGKKKSIKIDLVSHPARCGRFWYISTSIYELFWIREKFLYDSKQEGIRAIKENGYWYKTYCRLCPWVKECVIKIGDGLNLIRNQNIMFWKFPPYICHSQQHQPSKTLFLKLGQTNISGVHKCQLYQTPLVGL